MCTFSFVQHAKGSDFDPFCKEGLTDTSLSACCQADCGECADGSEHASFLSRSYLADEVLRAGSSSGGIVASGPE